MWLGEQLTHNLFLLHHTVRALGHDWYELEPFRSCRGPVTLPLYLTIPRLSTPAMNILIETHKNIRHSRSSVSESIFCDILDLDVVDRV